MYTVVHCFFFFCFLNHSYLFSDPVDHHQNHTVWLLGSCEQVQLLLSHEFYNKTELHPHGLVGPRVIQGISSWDFVPLGIKRWIVAKDKSLKVTYWKSFAILTQHMFNHKITFLCYILVYKMNLQKWLFEYEGIRSAKPCYSLHFKNISFVSFFLFEQF